MRSSTKPKTVRVGRSRRRAKKARARQRIGAVRAVPKPKGRAEQIEWAENLGFEALATVTGGNPALAGRAAAASRLTSGVSKFGANTPKPPVGGAATHGGATSTAGCCPWQSVVKRSLERIGMPRLGAWMHEGVVWGKTKLGM
jgi:hypothetical protein